MAKTKKIDVEALTNQTDVVTVKLLQYYANTIIQYDKYEQQLMPFNIYEGPDRYFEVRFFHI